MGCRSSVSGPVGILRWVTCLGVWCSGLLGVVACASAPAELNTSEPTVVYLVRHTEKVTDVESDPPLSAMGAARAVSLARDLASAGIDRVLSTPFERTRATATPFAQQKDIKIESMEVSGLEAHIEEMASIVEASPGLKFLIVGHSNTVPLVIARLGGPQIEINEDQYGDLFVLTIDESSVEFRRQRYGDLGEPE